MPNKDHWKHNEFLKMSKFLYLNVHYYTVCKIWSCGDLWWLHKCKWNILPEHWLPFYLQQVHCPENLKHIFPEMKLRGFVPNFYIHIQYLYHIIIYHVSQINECGNWETEHYNSVFVILTWQRSCIPGNTWIGTRYLHVYCILTGPSIAMYSTGGRAHETKANIQRKNLKLSLFRICNSWCRRTEECWYRNITVFVWQ